VADDDSRSGRTTYWTPVIGRYLGDLFARETDGMRDALASIERAGLPAIQLGPTEGRILEVIVRMVQARRVVEIGTLAGYSAQWLARGLGRDGHLWTIEADPHHARVARGVLERAGLAQRVEVLEGRALQMLPGLEGEGPFDAVFIDADKAAYGEYAAWAARHLRPGGAVIGDNTYLFGRLAGVEPHDDDERAAIDGMRRFHQVLARDFDAVCLPTPDGLSVGVRRRDGAPERLG
jgi:caffeoyl-CoA O-methyltransferase